MDVLLTKVKNKKNSIVFFIKRLLARYYSRKVLIDFDENWFKGKKVAIIGGADSVLKEPLGDYIDSFDVLFSLTTMDLIKFINEARRLGMHKPLFQQKNKE